MTDNDQSEGIEATIEAAQLRAAANQFRLKLRQHQQKLREVTTPRRREN